jgi:hypothetical protein
MSEDITRRVALLTAAAVAILSGDRGAAGSPTADDGELFRLEAEFKAALAHDRASNSIALLSVEAAAADASAALEKSFALAEAILQTPATTLAGVMVKLRLQHFYFVESDGYAELLESVTADLERWTAPAGSGSPPRRKPCVAGADGDGVRPAPRIEWQARRWGGRVAIEGPRKSDVAPPRIWTLAALLKSHLGFSSVGPTNSSQNRRRSVEI